MTTNNGRVSLEMAPLEAVGRAQPAEEAAKVQSRSIVSRINGHASCLPQCGCLQGRVVAYISMSLLLAFGCLGSAACAVGFGLKDWRESAAGVAMFVFALLFSCGCIFWLTPQKALENRVKDLGKENQKLISQISAFSENLQTLDATRAELEKVKGEAKASVDALEKSLKETTDNLDDIAKKYADVQTKLDVMTKLYQQYRDVANAIAKDVKDLKTLPKTLNDQATKVDTAANNLGDTEHALSVQMDQFKSADEFYQKHNKFLQELVASMHTDMTTLQSGIQGLMDQLDRMKSQTAALDKVDDRLEGLGDKLGTQGTRLAELLKEFQKVADQLRADSVDSPSAPTAAAAAAAAAPALVAAVPGSGSAQATNTSHDGTLLSSTL